MANVQKAEELKKKIKVITWKVQQSCAKTDWQWKGIQLEVHVMNVSARQLTT